MYKKPNNIRTVNALRSVKLIVLNRSHCSYFLQITTITTPKSERSESVASDQETILDIEPTPTKGTEISEQKEAESPKDKKTLTNSTPEKKGLNTEETTTVKQQTPNKYNIDKENADEDKKVNKKSENVQNNEDYKKVDNNPSVIDMPKKEIETPKKDGKVNSIPEQRNTTQDHKVNTKSSDESPKSSTIPVKCNTEKRQICMAEDNALTWEKVTETPSTKEESINFLQHERLHNKSPKTPKIDYKMGTKLFYFKNILTLVCLHRQ